MSQCLNNPEKLWLKYYTGDVSGNDPFWSEPKAYLVLNSLFYDGMETEMSRSAEGKFLNPTVLDDVDRLLDFYDNMFSAFRKCRADSDILTYRVERHSDFIPIQKTKHTISFTSTSTGGFLDAYRDRKGITLIKFLIPESISCINVAEVLDFYAKSDEQEVLLPPFMELDLTETVPTENELSITDSDGKSPVNSYRAVCRAFDIKERTGNISRDGARAGQRVYNALNNGMIPESEDTEIYTQWKKDFISLYKNCCT
ncbi:MAG: hypothetical protein NC177_03260 [Ruminococcus flavefaciens]|nr:hypothetical protein [Ruminococcus flavefaciens]